MGLLVWYTTHKKIMDMIIGVVDGDREMEARDDG
jgi:hypothetical protein